MPERSFGRTIRYRRTKLGLSQAKLGDLVGRSPSTIRSWEKDKSYPNETKVLVALSAILGVDERMLFEKAGQEPPEIETHPTIEEELATLKPAAPETAPVPADSQVFEDLVEIMPVEPPHQPVMAPTSSPPASLPAYSAPPSPYHVTMVSPPVDEPSYIEDSGQRQLYRLRYLATIVLLVGLGIALMWAMSESFGALGDWWDQFFGNLRL